ncbi:hypothetical protein KY346_05615 [Candidatus Woesearchaeota archaeon]|nr:hypothetical protein [Candidatus Woesearchaeota archaeon]
MENKAALLVLIIVAILAAIGLVLFFKTSFTGEYGYKPYSGQEMLNWYPYAEKRTVKGGVSVLPFQGAKVAKTDKAYEETKYGMFRRRYPGRTYTALLSCAGQIPLGNVPEGFSEPATYMEMEDRYFPENCVEKPKELERAEFEYCCRPTKGY